MYIYESHLGGGFYVSEEPIPFEDLYCEECGDSDWEVGQADTKEEAMNLLMERYSDCYDESYIREFVEGNFEDEEE